MTPEELRRLAQCLDTYNAGDEYQRMTEGAASALRSYADSLERAGPSKMNDIEIAAHHTRFFDANPLAESADWDLHFQDLRDKQWRGE